MLGFKRLVTLLLGVVCFYTGYAQVDLTAVRVSLLRGDGDSVVSRLETALASSVQVQNDTLLRARVIELLGEHYYRLSDIDEARRLWGLAKGLRKSRFGVRSPEYGVALAFDARYHNYMSASQLDHQRYAVASADEAYGMVVGRSGAVDAYEELLVRRERAYAHKVRYGPTGDGSDPELVKARALFMYALDFANEHRDIIGMAQIHHDIGNTYTDRVIPLRGREEVQAEAISMAQLNYRRSLELLRAAGLVPSEASMMDHFTLGLLYHYSYRTDSLSRAIEEIDEALRTLVALGGREGVEDPVRFWPEVRNRAQMVELFHYRVQFLLELYGVRADPKILDEAIRTNAVSIAYWEAMMREYRSKAMFKVAGSYGHFPYRQGALLYALRHWSNGSDQDAVTSLVLSGRDRNAQLQRRMFRQGMNLSGGSLEELKASQLKVPPGRLVIMYHEYISALAYVIDSKGLKVIELPPIPVDPTRSYGRFNEFSIDSLEIEPGEFARQGYRLFKALLEPLVKGRPERELVIIPLGSLSNLSFEALPMSPSARSWADMSFVGEAFNVRYALTLDHALSDRSIELDVRTALGVVEVDTLSTLPFAEALVNRLVGELPEARRLDVLTKSELLGELGSPGLLHIATHAHAPDEPDSLPYLITKDGALVADLLWDRAVRKQLVVLSTCTSGSGRVYLGQGVVSMGQSMLEAGAGVVVHTLWPVDDRATSEVLERMYRGMMEGLTAAQALHLAKQEFREAHRNDGLCHPFYWAGIVIVGSDAAMPRRRSSAPLYIAVFLVAGALFFIGYKRSRRAVIRSFSSGSATD